MEKIIAIPPRTPDALMPWGKHKGTRLDELPIRYLRWLAERATRTQGTKIALAAAAEYVWRVKQENERRVAAGLQPMPAPPDEIVRER